MPQPAARLSCVRQRPWGAVDVRGGAPGTRETDLLNAHNLVEEVTAVVLSGGSAFGLSTADGVMRWHRERGLGYHSRGGFTVPIVPAAILFDLGVGEKGAFPGADALLSSLPKCQHCYRGIRQRWGRDRAPSGRNYGFGTCLQGWGGFRGNRFGKRTCRVRVDGGERLGQCD